MPHKKIREISGYPHVYPSPMDHMPNENPLTRAKLKSEDVRAFLEKEEMANAPARYFLGK